MKKLDRTARLVVIGAGLGAAFSANSEFLGHALRIRPIYLLAGIVAWYAFLIVLFVRGKRAACN
jgi:hypothetical protein